MQAALQSKKELLRSGWQPLPALLCPFCCVLGEGLVHWCHAAVPIGLPTSPATVATIQVPTVAGLASQDQLGPATRAETFNVINTN